MKLLYWCIVGFAALIFIVSSVAWWLNRPGLVGMEAAGQSGDYWGGHFAGLGTIVAALLFVVAIFLQRDELKAQREELALTRAEMARARQVSTAQVEQLTEQTFIAKRSAIVNQVLEVLQYRSGLAREQRGIDVFEAQGANRFNRVAREMERIDPYLESLLKDDALDGDEEANLRAAAALDDLEAMKESYGSLQLDVGRRPSGQLQLTLTFTNVSPFQFRLGNAFFCSPQFVEGREDTAGQPKWTVHHRTMQPTTSSTGEVSSGVKRQFVIGEWQPISRERIEMAPEDAFSCRLETPGHTFTLKDGASIKKRILDNMGA